jgi:hypothetical protein
MRWANTGNVGLLVWSTRLVNMRTRHFRKNAEQAGRVVNANDFRSEALELERVAVRVGDTRRQSDLLDDQSWAAK